MKLRQHIRYFSTKAKWIALLAGNVLAVAIIIIEFSSADMADLLQFLSNLKLLHVALTVLY